MRKKLLFLLVLLLTAATNTWATDGIECSASDIGKVLCTDGSIYATVNDATAASKTAAAVIVYVDETNKNGLAIALADEGTMNWSTAKSTCESKTPTVTGAKWCLPSQDQWMKMFKANGGNTTSYTGLNTTITNAGGENLQQDNTYWSSSERVYLVSGGGAYWGNMTEDAYLVRACLAFAPPSYAITLAEGTEDAKNWTVPAEATKGSTITATYSGERKVKSVKAVKKNTAKTLAEATTDDIGKIAGKDGNIYATKADAEAVATGNAVAMIAYVGTASECDHGLAIALADESGTKDYEAAGTACSGKAAVTGGTWRLPSEKDWQYMFIGCGSSEAYSAPTSHMTKSCSGLASKLTTAQGVALQFDDYWSSTDAPDDYVWEVNFGDSHAVFYDVYKGLVHEYRVRACLVF